MKANMRCSCNDVSELAPLGRMKKYAGSYHAKWDTLTFAACTILSLLAPSARAQVSYNAAGDTYSQNFDNVSVSNSGTAGSWTDNSTIPGWYQAQTGTNPKPTIITVDNGSSNAGGLHLFGTDAPTTPGEYALGSIASGTAIPTFGVRFTNNTGQSLTSFSLGYTGEEWRSGTNPNTLTFAYSVGATGLTTGTYTDVASLNFTGPASGSNIAINGNSGDNQVTFAPTTISGLTWDPGQDLWLRWSDVNDAGNDAGLGVDNITFTADAEPAAAPEPSSMAVMALGIGGLGVLVMRRRRKAQSEGDAAA